MADDNQTDTKVGSFVMRYLPIIVYAITIIGLIVTLSVKWSKMDSRIEIVEKENTKVQVDVVKIQDQASTNAVQFAEIQKDLTSIRSDLSQLGLDTIDVRKQLTDIQIVLYSMRDSLLQGK